jgi:hypothetical protein
MNRGSITQKIYHNKKRNLKSRTEIMSTYTSWYVFERGQFWPPSMSRGCRKLHGRPELASLENHWDIMEGCIVKEFVANLANVHGCYKILAGAIYVVFTYLGGKEIWGKWPMSCHLCTMVPCCDFPIIVIHFVFDEGISIERRGNNHSMGTDFS